MSKPISELPVIMVRLAKAIPRVSDKLAKRSALAIARALIFDTPVDVGIARSNWVASRNLPFTGVIPAHFPLPKRTDPTKFRADGGNGQRALDLVRLIVRGFNLTRDRDLWISNNVHYIGRLNNQSPPHSVQSTAWVQTAFFKGVESIKGFPFVRELCRELRGFGGVGG